MMPATAAIASEQLTAPPTRKECMTYLELVSGGGTPAQVLVPCGIEVRATCMSGLTRDSSRCSALGEVKQAAYTI